jgi:surface protein
MSNMFTNATAFNQNIAYNPVTGSWNTGSVTDMSGMFAGARSFNQPIGNWNTAKVTDMSSMFSGAKSFNQPLDWYTVGVESMQEMFKNASAFNQNIGSWHLGSIAYNLSMQSMLDGSGMDCSNYAKTIAGWWLGATNGQTGINLGASGLSYTGAIAKTAHDFLVNARGWIITGDRYDPDCVPNPAVTGVTGDIVTQVWLSETQPPLFVKRHYQITPQNDPEHAAGRVTLYFSNQDFKDFNNQNPVPAKLLPDADEQATIDERKSNLRIEKRSSTSTDASGLPGSYTGAVLTINPNDEDIVWNSSTSLWEVSFDVTGFSGFFIKTTESTLPVTFGDLSAIFKNNQLYINWATLSETGNSHFEIEASKDGKTFTKIATVSSKAAGGNSENPVSYEWVATTPNTGIMLGLSAFVMGLSLLAFGRKRKVVYMATVLIALSITGLVACRKYSNENELDNHSKLFIRIKQVDKDGKAEYSKTVQVVKE